MNQLKTFLFFMISLTITSKIYSLTSIIRLHLQKYPYSKILKPDLLDPEKYSKKLQQPEYLSRKAIKNLQTKQREIPGIMCIYAGKTALSDYNGQVIFPRLQQTSSMNILVTKKINPAYILAPGTVHHWIIDNQEPTKIYSMEFKHDDATTLYYYDVTQVKIPDNKIIPLNTVIIIADPQDIFIPLGATIVNYSPNVILPTIYIKKSFCFIYNSLYTLAIKQYFGSTKNDFQQELATVSQLTQSK